MTPPYVELSAFTKEEETERMRHISMTVSPFEHSRDYPEANPNEPRNRAALLCLSLSSAVLAASSWTFEDATLTVQAKGAGVGGAATKEKIANKRRFRLTPNSPPNAFTLPSTDTLKIILTTTEGKTAKRPHQAFLTLQEPSTGLEESFPFSVKDNGKGKVELTQKDLPFQFLSASQSLKASIVLGSFGSSTPFNRHTFDLTIEADPNASGTIPSPPERYTSKQEIHHIFKDDPKSPPKVISLFFTLAVLVTLPALLGAWAYIGGNLDHAGKAFGANPAAHGLFFGSIVAMEGVFFMYYLSWNLFQTLPVAGVVAVVAYVSGSRALTEVQDRRLAGER
nr:isoform 2 of dolichyl-diphosphooligosaccharide--protein glycosyltransferase subunit 2 [Quercus suber]